MSLKDLDEHWLAHLPLSPVRFFLAAWVSTLSLAVLLKCKPKVHTQRKKKENGSLAVKAGAPDTCANLSGSHEVGSCRVTHESRWQAVVHELESRQASTCKQQWRMIQSGYTCETRNFVILSRRVCLHRYRGTQHLGSWDALFEQIAVAGAYVRDWGQRAKQVTLQTTESRPVPFIASWVRASGLHHRKTNTTQRSRSHGTTDCAHLGCMVLFQCSRRAPAYPARAGGVCILHRTLLLTYVVDHNWLEECVAVAAAVLGCQGICFLGCNVEKKTVEKKGGVAVATFSSSQEPLLSTGKQNRSARIPPQYYTLVFKCKTKPQTSQTLSQALTQALEGGAAAHAAHSDPWRLCSSPALIHRAFALQAAAPTCHAHYSCSLSHLWEKTDRLPASDCPLAALRCSQAAARLAARRVA
eukprot:999161-Pelagomonas_calceolata.AAC.6